MDGDGPRTSSRRSMTRHRHDTDNAPPGPPASALTRGSRVGAALRPAHRPDPHGHVRTRRLRACHVERRERGADQFAWGSWPSWVRRAALTSARAGAPRAAVADQAQAQSPTFDGSSHRATLVALVTDAPPPGLPARSRAARLRAGSRGRSRRRRAPPGRARRPAGPHSRIVATTRPSSRDRERARRPDIVFLGERGQAKTRLAHARRPPRRVAAGRPRRRAQRRARCADQRRGPASSRGRDVTPIDWLPRDRRYRKLATLDITIADRSQVTSIRRRGSLPVRRADLHYPHPALHQGSSRSTSCRPAERIQVGLLNILEERDVQIRGFTIRLPLTCSWSRPRTPRTTRAAAGSSRRSRTAWARRSDPLPAASSTRSRSRPGEAGLRPETASRGKGRRSCGAGAEPRTRPAAARDQPAERRLGPRQRRQHGGPGGGGDQAGGALASLRRQPATRGCARVHDRGRGRDGRRGHARGAHRERLVTKAVFATFNRHASLDRRDRSSTRRSLASPRRGAATSSTAGRS